jgi:hypothetical protein
VLKASNCFDGPVNGSISDAQKGVKQFVEVAREKGKDKPGVIELATASAADFDSWLREANDVKSNLCVMPKPEQRVTKSAGAPSPAARPRPTPDRLRRTESHDALSSGGERRVRCWNGRTAISVIGCRNGTQ